ncbi:unnamed protein product [Caenorhabditis sp. 36 PRJEB53466]|nr:unnamed protein product [Caenorhabditis sp. 36 PRJEB53466]
MSSLKVAFVSRLLMFCLDLAMLLCASVLVVWGSFMNNSAYDRHLKDVVFNYNSSEPLATDKFYLRAWVWAVYWSIYGLSIGAFLIAIIGLIGALSRKKAVIGTFLVLMVPFVLLEVGGGVTVWTKRGSLRRLIDSFVADMYTINSLFDIQIIQNTYNCCGIRTGEWTCDARPPCDMAVFNSVDNTQMIAALVFLPVLFFQIVLVALPIVILVFEPRMERKTTSQ